MRQQQHMLAIAAMCMVLVGFVTTILRPQIVKVGPGSHTPLHHPPATSTATKSVLATAAATDQTDQVSTTTTPTVNHAEGEEEATTANSDEEKEAATIPTDSDGEEDVIPTNSDDDEEEEATTANHDDEEKEQEEGSTATASTVEATTTVASEGRMETVGTEESNRGKVTSHFDFRGCYDQVKEAFSVKANSTTISSFCQSSCIQKLRTQLLAKKSRLFLEQGLGKSKKVLVNSPGGVVSTYFVEQFQKKFRLQTNDRSNHDHLKHSRPTRLVGKRREYNELVKGFDRILYLVGDPIHAIFSLFRRGWDHGHFRNLCGSGCSYRPEWEGNATAVFATSTVLGYDAWSLQSQAHEWMLVQTLQQFGIGGSGAAMGKDAAKQVLSKRALSYSWPHILITDLESVVESPAVLAHFLGVSVKSVQRTIRSKSSSSPAELEQRQAAERQAVQAVGALPLYLQIERDWQDAVARNYLCYGIQMYCGATNKQGAPATAT